MPSKVNIRGFLIFSLLYLVSCGKKEKELTPEEIQFKADSIFRIKLEKLQQEAKEDLDRRMSIELKPKVDSLRKVTKEIPSPPSLQPTGIEDDSLSIAIDTLTANPAYPKGTLPKTDDTIQ